METVIVLAVLALVATLVMVLATPGASGRLARDLQGLLLAARLEATLKGYPVAVVWQPGPAAFEVRSAGPGSSAPEACAGAPARRLLLARYPGTEVVRRLADQVVWMPDGLGRSCSGGAVFNGTIELRAGGQGHRVVLAAGGRIRVGAVP